MPPPTLAIVPPTPEEEEKLFSQMSQQELGDVIHNIVMHKFSFARKLASALNGGHDHKELEKFIIEESIKELEHLLLKKGTKNILYCKKVLF